MNARNILLSVAIAGLAGAILGLLYAPIKGSDARKRLARIGTSFAAQAMPDTVTDGVIVGGEFDTFKDSALDWADMGEATVFSRSSSEPSW